MFGMAFCYWRNERSKEYYVSEWLSYGWICAQRDNYWTCLSLLATHSSISDVLFRILQQLLAFGLFREPASEQFWSDRCGGCHYENHGALIARRQCHRLILIVDEFFHSPLSLLQLSRVEIREGFQEPHGGS